MFVSLKDCIYSFVRRFAVYSVKNDGFYKLIENAERQALSNNLKNVISFLNQSEHTLSTRLDGYKNEANIKGHRGEKAKKIAIILETIKESLINALKAAQENKVNDVKELLNNIKESFEKTEPLVRDYQKTPQI